MTKALFFLFLFPSVSFAAFDTWLAQDLKAKNSFVLKTHTRICAFVPGGCTAWVDKVTGIYVAGRDGNAIYRLTSSGDSRLRPWVYPGGSWSYGGGSWSVTSSGFGISYNGRLCMRNWGPFGIRAAKMTWTGPAPDRAAMCNFSPTTAWPADWGPSWFDTHVCSGEYDFLGRYEVRFGGDDTRHFTVLTCNQSFELGAFPEYRADELSCPRPAADFDNHSVVDELRAGYSALAASSVAHERDYASAIRTDVDKAVEYLTEGVVSTGSVATGNYFPNPFSGAASTAPMYTLENADSGGQTWLTGTALPRNFSVAVKNSDGSLVSGHPVTFSVTAAPASDWSFLPGEPGQPVTLDSVNGIAETGFKLGTTPGEYLMSASCPDCCPKVTFTASALTTAQVTELRPHNCDSTGYIGTPLLDSVRVKAVNTLTGNPVPGRQVVFTLVSHPGGTGMLLLPSAPDPAATNLMGIAKAALTLGSIPGNYRVSAVCQSCEAGQEAVCDIEALPTPEKYDIVPGVSPLVLKKSPIAVVVTPETVPPGNSADIIARGPPGITLLASVEPVPNTGGHQHTNHVRPAGTIAPASGVLNSEGEVPFTYTAGEVGGQERLIFRVSGSADYGDAVILVSVPGLERLGPGPDYYLSGETPTHPSNHYGTELLRGEIPNIARAYTDIYGAFLRVDDMSLINGGLFDVCGNWNTSGCPRNPGGGHSTHREGRNADFGYHHLTNARRLERVPDMYTRLRNILTTHPEIQCRTTYPGSHIECP
ncbi:MAG: hypothetical protein RDU13_10135 [Elusimicrobiales bacterium]|nr:hypothetical protein [Elusimicrobiales bacterium]